MNSEEDVSEQLNSLIEQQEWEACSQIFRDHPNESKKIYTRYHRTKLHWLCSLGSTPAELIDLVASLNPDAIAQKETSYGDTCLHIICRNSQISDAKLNAVLKHCSSDTVLIRNHMGATPLHSAANHNACLPALVTLTDAHPEVLRVTTYEGMHAVTALWLAFVQTIPGLMLVSRILKGETVTSQLFDRFWTKVEHLAGGRENVLHRLLHANVPIKLFKVCLKTRPETALAVTASGNYPLHVLVETRPYRLTERQAIEACLQAAPHIAGIANLEGCLPLQISIRNKIPVASGVDLLLNAAPLTVRSRDHDNFYPFQQAAAVSGPHAVDTAYHLLRRQPDLVNSGRMLSTTGAAPTVGLV